MPLLATLAADKSPQLHLAALEIVEAVVSFEVAVHQLACCVAELVFGAG